MVTFNKPAMTKSLPSILTPVTLWKMIIAEHKYREVFQMDISPQKATITYHDGLGFIFS